MLRLNGVMHFFRMVHQFGTVEQAARRVYDSFRSVFVSRAPLSLTRITDRFMCQINVRWIRFARAIFELIESNSDSLVDRIVFDPQLALLYSLEETAYPHARP